LEFLTSREVCEYLAITPNNLHQIQYRGALRWSKKEGKKIYYIRDDVEAFKAKRKK
jgi:predicted site-specific integrase-resolvase